jgi:hypothetical protein
LLDSMRSSGKPSSEPHAVRRSRASTALVVISLVAATGCGPRVPSLDAHGAHVESDRLAADGGPPNAAAVRPEALERARVGGPLDGDGPLPAGLCSFSGYLHLSAACEGVPTMTHALLLGEVRGRAPAEALVAAWTGKVPPGYPIVLATSELPLDGEEHRQPESSWSAPRRSLLADLPAPRHRGTLRVVAGFFADEDTARRWNVVALGGAGTVHVIAGPPPLPSDDYLAFERSRDVAVAIVHPAPAYADADVVRAEASVNTRSGGGGEDARWDRALATLKPACAVRAGQVFQTDRATLYDQGRRFAPVECDGGRLAWVRWAATRLESVVRVEKDGAFTYQIIDVMCDSASIDRTPFAWAAPLVEGTKSHAACGRGRS